jgi:hypothetical protein
MPSSEEKSYYITKSLEEQQAQVKELYDLHHALEKATEVRLERLDNKSRILYVLAGAIPGIAAILLMLLKGLL